MGGLSAGMWNSWRSGLLYRDKVGAADVLPLWEPGGEAFLRKVPRDVHPVPPLFRPATTGSAYLSSLAFISIIMNDVMLKLTS